MPFVVILCYFQSDNLAIPSYPNLDVQVWAVFCLQPSGSSTGRTDFIERSSLTGTSWLLVSRLLSSVYRALVAQMLWNDLFWSVALSHWVLAGFFFRDVTRMFFSSERCSSRSFFLFIRTHILKTWTLRRDWLRMTGNYLRTQNDSMLCRSIIKNIFVRFCIIQNLDLINFVAGCNSF